VSVTRLCLKDRVAGRGINPRLPVEADSISPDRFAGLSQEEVATLPILYGRRRLTVGDLFTVEADAAGTDPDAAEEIIIEASVDGTSDDLSHVKRIGQEMSQGRVTIRGDVGMHLGARMSGGEIVVHGDAAAWAGAHMAGGVIRVHGNAGPMLGAGYAGEKRGMRGGVILVDGDAGPRCGERMRRGMIVVQGDVGEFAGARMIAGSLFAFGALGARAGAGMKRGTIVALGGLDGDPLPVFRYACAYSPTFLRYYLLRLRAWGLPVRPEHIEGLYRRYVGDVNTLGKGEILVYDQR